MREILFRGKELYGDKWVYGVPVPVEIDGYKTDRIDMTKSHGYDELDGYELLSDDTEVIPETVGQFTGLTDKNGKKVFEGDILAAVNYAGEQRIDGVIKYGKFNCSCCDGVYGWYIDDGDIRALEPPAYLEVIGNIHDNPELLGD